VPLPSLSRRLTVLALAFGLAASSACSTTKSLLGADAERRPYSGVRSMMNADAVEAMFILWPIDFILSGIADTLLLPYTMSGDEDAESD
jgi:uncharacterized protein YceK